MLLPPLLHPQKTEAYCEEALCRDLLSQNDRTAYKYPNICYYELDCEYVFMSVACSEVVVT